MHKNKEINFSIIIPHYNIPELLERCLRSIPIREDIQVIVVDDCSPNAETYIPMDANGKSPLTENPYVEFYHTPIGGSAGRARNVGLEHAKGKWLTFLDADDLFVENAIAIFERIKARSEDILYFQTKSVMNDDLSKPSNRNCFSRHFNLYFETKDDSWLRYYFDALWGKLIKKDLVEKHNIRFEEIKLGNDSFFSITAGIFAKDIVAFEDVLYINTERQGSLTSAKQKSFIERKTRYENEIRLQNFLDAHRVTFLRTSFAEDLIHMSKTSFFLFVSEFIRLSIKNKYRFLCFCGAWIKRKIKSQASIII